jgi:anti-sigma regulatory factor (Ser/Thr protein kinase)
MPMQRKIEINDASELLDTDELFYKEFPSDIRQVRFFTLLVVQKAPAEIKEFNLLEQQISELIKNAVKHGNKMDSEKKVKVWFRFTKDRAHVVVQDEGEGFQDIEKWNHFNEERMRHLREENFERLADYVSYRTEASDDTDGGNALFAALEYWNGGVVFNKDRNAIAVLKLFPRRHRELSAADE